MNIENSEKIILFDNLTKEFSKVQNKINQSNKNMIGSLIDQFYTKHKSMRQKQNLTAPEVNIFKLTGLTTEEVKHSTILAWFLDPLETHAQGSLFFRIFLEKLSFPKEYSDDDYTVKKEVYYEEGRTDIEIESDKFYIVIENKILSGEGETQLFRYNKIIGSKQNKNTYAIFLTPFKKPPSEKNFTLLSYFEITKMLRKFQNEAKAEKVKWVVEQYIDLVEEYILSHSRKTEEEENPDAEI